MIASPSIPSSSIHPLLFTTSSTSDISTIPTDDQDKTQLIDGAEKGKKRESESDISNSQQTKKARQSLGDSSESGKKDKRIYCHICRRICEPNRYLRCTQAKGNAQKQCHLSYCDRDLTVRYGIPSDRLSSIRGDESMKQDYSWKCPCCKDDCQSSNCRKKKGLDPIGNLSKAKKTSELGGKTLQTNGHLATPSTSISPSKDRSPTKSESNAVMDTSLIDVQAHQVKKKRGRPSKVHAGIELGLTEVQIPKPKKKRGRPSKVHANLDPTLPAVETSTPKKKRGRPSKAGKEITEEQNHKSEEQNHKSEEQNHKSEEQNHKSSSSSDLSAITPEQPVQPKKRGRPSLASSQKIATPNGRKRGRPPKVNDGLMAGFAPSTPKFWKLKAESTNTPKSAISVKMKANGEPKKKTGPKPKSTPIVEITKTNKKSTQQDGKSTPKRGRPAAKDGEKIVKPKPDIIPEPPVYQKVDTKLGREEAEQRIMLREYLFRFRSVLSFPERALPPLDDFERPLTESSVRLFAGAMLDVIKEELQNSEDEELNSTLFNVREELRYYADLARFQAIYNLLSEPLNLRPPPLVIDQRAEANESALRAILDLDENQPPPAWAAEYTAGPSRRTGASRIPPPPEVIRMLLALADRTLSTPKIRGDMESSVPDIDVRKKHASAVKSEVATMETKKKKLQEARLKCKTAKETNAIKEEYSKDKKEHAMRLAMIDVNLEAQLARRALRHEALGQDLDGRIYYLLAPRVIEEEGRPPSGWASSLLVWGKGVEGKSESSGLPVSVERWSHFGKAKELQLLIKWIEWKFQKHLESIKPSNLKTPKKIPTTPLENMLDSATITPGSNMKQQTLIEEVIPSSAKESSSTDPLHTPLSTEAEALTPDASSTSSGLTPPPISNKDGLLELVKPKDYLPSRDTIEENGKNLVSKLQFVLKWLEVLEWQGYGEIA
ncbi:uncharacterized protein I206_104108 [Kwoniella pini CBS 10737]|uniref:Zinc-finger domain-containing protein n=1 Tax=Kwoniella pini CBS 10737 TaxID=1296096 RepID=A0A1B9I2K8_9TREE|nr:uncharacterized protein I206_04316 [Kwoniella pini CBS 10737]OCF49790.1 hypothetical protein I206_04316 [Kwoniella pini CBS 10737]